MKTISEQIREAALGPRPTHPKNTHVWFGKPYGKGSHPLGDVCDDLLLPYGRFEGAREATQRTFLLLVAEAVK